MNGHDSAIGRAGSGAPKSANIRAAVLFAAFMTFFLTAFRLASHGGDGILGKDEMTLIYYFHCLLYVPGFASFAVVDPEAEYSDPVLSPALAPRRDEPPETAE